MPKLNDIKGIAEKQKKKPAKEVPALIVEDTDLISRYNAAADRAKQAEGVMAEIAPKLTAEGLSYVFSHNCACRTDTKKQIKSVNLVEVQDDGTQEVVQFTWSTRAGKIDEEVIKAHFTDLSTIEGKEANPNQYAEWVINAEFDKKALLDSKGKFMQARFDRFKKALDEAAAELGIENPLTFNKEFKVTKEANDLRFQQFTPAQNMELHLVLPTSTSLEPVRSKEDE